MPVTARRARVILPVALIGGLAGCKSANDTPEVGDGSPAALEQPHAPSEPQPAAPPCRLHALPWSEPGCCAGTDGFSPDAVVNACGFTEYLGQARDWGCAHTFRAGDETHRFRVTTLAPLTLPEALQRHRSGFRPDDPATELGPVPGLEGSEANTHGEFAWAFVPRGDAPLRLSWARAACSLDKLAPVLQQVSRSEPSATRNGSIAAVVAEAGAKARVQSARPGSLLAAYADRPPLTADESAEYTLPFKSKRMHIALLIAVAHQDEESLPRLLTPNARYGLPDRRELGAQAVFAGDGGRGLLAQLRPVLQRLPEDTPWTARPMLRQVQDLVESGSAPMWVHYAHEGDVFTLRLIGPAGAARIDYVGFWPDGPNEALNTDGEPPPPPTIPAVVVNGRWLFDGKDAGPAGPG
ncbi:MAG: hypothetical protein AAF721_37700 [Myxococcota bacterium]